MMFFDEGRRGGREIVEQEQRGKRRGHDEDRERNEPSRPLLDGTFELSFLFVMLTAARTFASSLYLPRRGLAQVSIRPRAVISRLRCGKSSRPGLTYKSNVLTAILTLSRGILFQNITFVAVMPGMTAASLFPDAFGVCTCFATLRCAVCHDGRVHCLRDPRQPLSHGGEEEGGDITASRIAYLVGHGRRRPDVLFENAAKSVARESRCSALAFWLAAALAGYWSFAIGLFVIAARLSRSRAPSACSPPAGGARCRLRPAASTAISGTRSSRVAISPRPDIPLNRSV